jgi:hypothetical protein
MCGTTAYPLVEQIRDTIKAHGLAWAVKYYFEKLPREVARFFLTAAYCY